MDETAIFEKSCMRLRKSKSRVIVQRFNKPCFKEVDKNEDDDLIVVRHTTNLTNKDIENYNSLDGLSINNFNIKEECLMAMTKCKHNARIFFILEKTCKGTEHFSAVFAIFVATIKLNFYVVVTLCLILLTITILDSFGDWSRLREKYSNIYHKFESLCNYEGVDKIMLFESYTKMYDSNTLSIDTLVLDLDLSSK